MDKTLSLTFKAIDQGVGKMFDDQGESSVKAVKTLQRYQDEVNRLTAQAEAERLQRSGQTAAAEIRLIEATEAHKLTLIKRSLEQRLSRTKDPEYRERLKVSAGAQSEAVSSLASEQIASARVADLRQTQAARDRADAERLSVQRKEEEENLADFVAAERRAEAVQDKADAEEVAFIQRNAAEYQLDLAKQRKDIELRGIQNEGTLKSDQSEDRMRFRSTKPRGGNAGGEGSKPPTNFDQDLRQNLRSVFLIDRIGGILDSSAKQMLEVKNQFDAGKLSAAGMVEELAKGLPVLGHFVSTGQSLHEIIFNGPGSQFRDKNIDLENTGNAKSLADDAKEKSTETIARFDDASKSRQRESQRALLDYRLRSGNIGLTGASEAEYNLKATAAKEAADLENERQEKLQEQAAAEKQKLQENKDYSQKQRDAIKLTNAPQAVQNQQIKRVDTAEANETEKIHGERDEINADYDRRSLAQRQAALTERNNLESKHTRDLTELFRNYDSEALNAQNNTNLNLLRSQGKYGEADLLQIKQQTDAKITEIKRARDKQLDAALPEDRAQITESARLQIAAVQAESDSNVGLAKYKTQEEQKLRLLKLEADAGNAAAGADAKRLEFSREIREEKERAASLGLDTASFENVAVLSAQKDADDQHLSSLKFQSEAGDQLAGFELTRLDRAKALKDELAQINDILAHTTGIEHDQAQRDKDRVLASDGQSRDLSLRQNKEELLQSDASTNPTKQGRLKAKRDLETLKLGDDFKKQSAFAQSVLQDPKSSAQQREQATTQLQQFGNSVEQRFDSATQDKPASLKSSFGLKERGLLLTGASESAASKNHQENPLVKVTQQGLKVQQAILKAIESVLHASATNTAANPGGPQSVFGGK